MAKDSNAPSTEAQRSLFKELGIEQTPPTQTGCQLTLRYIEQGFPGHGHKSKAERIAYYNDACVQWIGKRVRFQDAGVSKVGTVASIRGLHLTEGKYAKLGTGSPLLAIIHSEELRGGHAPRSLALIELNE